MLAQAAVGALPFRVIVDGIPEATLVEQNANFNMAFFLRDPAGIGPHSLATNDFVEVRRSLYSTGKLMIIPLLYDSRQKCAGA